MITWRRVLLRGLCYAICNREGDDYENDISEPFSAHHPARRVRQNAGHRSDH